MTKKSSLLLVLAFLLIVVIGGYTYSRFTSSGTAKSTTQVAKWAVKLGTNDLDTYTTEAPLAATLNLDANSYVDANVIAPGSSGTFDVVIDPTGSQVAIDYVIKVGDITGLDDTNEKIKVTGAKYWIGDDTTGEGQDATVTGTDGATITESLADVKANKKVTVRVTVQWENDEANNETDTKNGKAAKEIAVNTTITAKQHIA